MHEIEYPFWRRMTDEEPKENAECIVRVADRISNYATYRKGKWYTFDGESYEHELTDPVTAWMPAPREPIF